MSMHYVPPTTHVRIRFSPPWWCQVVSHGGGGANSPSRKPILVWLNIVDVVATSMGGRCDIRTTN